MINLLLVDRQAAYLNGIKSLFESPESKIKVVGSANSCKKAIEFLEKIKTHIIMFDPSTNESLNNTCIEKIKKSFEGIKIVVLTNDLDINYLHNLWVAGVDGVELKNCGKKALFELIKQVMEGKRVMGNGIPDFMCNKVDGTRIHPKLSSKEKQIYQLMLSVNSHDEIAKKLKLPLIAVQFHCKNILKKVRKFQATINTDEIKDKLLAS